MTRARAAVLLGEAALLPRLLDDAALERLSSAVDLHPGVLTPATVAGALGDVDVLLTGWGAPPLDAALLDTAPRLRLVVHTAGTVKRLVTPAVWERGVRVTSGAATNALPVAEYALATVLLAAKRVGEAQEHYRARRRLDAWQPGGPVGTNGATVGVVGASRTGRRLLELLRPFDLRPVLHDPSLSPAEAADLGADLLPLDGLLAASDVVTLQAPALPATYRMIGAAQLALMRDGATLVNTARGSLVDTDALTAEVLRGRLRAVLDVTDPEPLPPDHPLFDAPGVVLTPHVAGSLGNELRRLGDEAVAEVLRWVRTGALGAEVRADDLARIA
ncbi:hydroxyacid dehydrogenase [Cellulomonas sp.]|uniref:hydroxyacid dehydrogenase n=1 Tax=Cellulomonas sp. TaxID=40001 RepID=UPI00281158F1|nr:hydroxyacid dehydrogenase [Cellulomonas sp.]